MSIQNFLKSLTSTPPRRRAIRRSPPASRLCLEPLEDRWVPSFGLPVDYAAGGSPEAMVSADFNGDGWLDLAAANTGENAVSLLLGNGEGTFQAARTSATGVGPASILAADLNGDAKTDLVMVNISYVYASPGDLSVLLGNGEGTFQPPQSVVLPAQFPPGYTGSDPLGQNPFAAAIGDLNADGKLDLVAAGGTQYSVLIGYDEYGYPMYESHTDAYVNVLLGNGDGTFGPSTAYHGSGGALHLGDFNSDGRTDVAVGSGMLRVMRGNGDGTLQDAQQTYVGAWFNISKPVGDFDSDGKLDLLMRDATGNFAVLLRGNGDGTFRPGEYVYAGTTMNAAVVGDVNADGKLDIVVLHTDIEYGSCDDYQCYDPLSIRTARVLLGYGDGSFALSAVSDLGTLTSESVFTSAVLADLDGDGLPDLAASASAIEFDLNYQGAVVVAHNNGTWTLPPPPPPSIRLGDVTVTEGNTGTGTAKFTVTLSAAYEQPVTVAYATAAGSATAGSDYQASSGTLAIPAGQTTGTITVPVNGDRLGEPDETFFVNLSNPTNATIADGQGVGNIFDDEPRISIGDVTKAEGKKGQTTVFTFTVTLWAAYDQAVTMSFATVNGTAMTSDADYVAKTGTLTFAPGETTKTITIEVKGDSKKEANETFTLELFGPSSNALLLDAVGLGTILNDD